ncbi:MAPEG family protein [Pseudoduganella ginsengisoli]|uniref:MAPEG family protein n=1 Tax=Pseudoduganella ginsengisoli TaxID=1462440 RepID=A0A6L6PW94_9BURK|nr:MAPEG family protein [Pseudoduganella ginsengisoli]MTW01833.1 hypothetical protein [Pseudoduganella ginsengisoli]
MKTIFHPVIALAVWTLLIQISIAFTRVRAGVRRQIQANDFKYGESPAVPPEVCIPNRNYMNLLEAPVLFYVACIVLFATAGATHATVALAWLYVALRIVHSLIHLTYNDVMHRLSAFASSNVVLAIMWLLTALHIAA